VAVRTRTSCRLHTLRLAAPARAVISVPMSDGNMYTLRTLCLAAPASAITIAPMSDGSMCTIIAAGATVVPGLGTRAGWRCLRWRGTRNATAMV
jgi:hypothetical protein